MTSSTLTSSKVLVLQSHSSKKKKVCTQGPTGHSLGKNKALRNEKCKDQLWDYVKIQVRYDKYFSIWLKMFVEHKLWNWKEWKSSLRKTGCYNHEEVGCWTICTSYKNIFFIFFWKCSYIYTLWDSYSFWRTLRINAYFMVHK